MQEQEYSLLLATAPARLESIGVEYVTTVEPVAGSDGAAGSDEPAI